MSDLVKVAESAAEQAEKFSQKFKRGGILMVPLGMLTLACALPASLAVAGCSDWVVAVMSLPVLLVLINVSWIVREAIRSRQMLLFAGEEVMIEAMRSGILGTREHSVTDPAVVKSLDEMRATLAAITVDHMGHKHTLQSGPYTQPPELAVGSEGNGDA